MRTYRYNSLTDIAPRGRKRQFSLISSFKGAGAQTRRTTSTSLVIFAAWLADVQAWSGHLLVLQRGLGVVDRLVRFDFLSLGLQDQHHPEEHVLWARYGEPSLDALEKAVCELLVDQAISGGLDDQGDVATDSSRLRLIPEPNDATRRRCSTGPKEEPPGELMVPPSQVS